MLTEDQENLIAKFPAKYSLSVLDAISDELGLRLPLGGIVLDPFAGTGGIHRLADVHQHLDTIGVDIEPELAALHPRTLCADSRDLVGLARNGRFAPLLGLDEGTEVCIDAVVTSPAYGNRLADQYLGSDREKCRKCDGTGGVPHPVDGSETCSRCGGTGRARSKRHGYAIALGRKLTDGSGAALPWGSAYRDLHEQVLDGCAQVLAPGGLWVINVSSALGAKGYMPVMEWWLGEIARRARIVGLRAVETPRLGFGRNAERRVPVEHLILAVNDDGPRQVS